MTSRTDTIEDHETRRKRLIYRAWHRGTREMDLILGSFANKYVPGFAEGELSQFEAFLNLSDPDLYNWISGQEEPPANIVNNVFEKIRAHRPKL
jgi:antitoxin CptB